MESKLAHTEISEGDIDAVCIDPVLIRDEYIRLPQQLSRAGMIYAAAHGNYLEADLAYDRTTAQMRIWHREHLESVGTRATEGAVKDAVENDQRWIDAKMNRISAEIERARAKAHVDAMHAKKDMLVSLGAHIRQELGNDPTIRNRDNIRDTRRAADSE